MLRSTSVVTQNMPHLVVINLIKVISQIECPVLSQIVEDFLNCEGRLAFLN